MLNGILTRWKLMEDDNFEKFYQELDEYLKKKLVYCPLPDGTNYWTINFDFIKYMEGYLPDAKPFKHTEQFCKEKRYDWTEVREMIKEYKGEIVYDDGEVLRQTGYGNQKTFDLRF